MLWREKRKKVWTLRFLDSCMMCVVCLHHATYQPVSGRELSRTPQDRYSQMHPCHWFLAGKSTRDRNFIINIGTDLHWTVFFFFFFLIVNLPAYNLSVFISHLLSFFFLKHQFKKRLHWNPIATCAEAFVQYAALCNYMLCKYHSGLAKFNHSLMNACQ